MFLPGAKVDGEVLCDCKKYKDPKEFVGSGEEPGKAIGTSDFFPVQITGPKSFTFIKSPIVYIYMYNLFN